MKAVITVGVSSSGKSTLAGLMKEYVTICRDDARFGVVSPEANGWRNYKFSKENEDLVTTINNQALLGCAERKQNVVIGDTNLNTKFRRKLIEQLQSLGYEVKIVVLHVALKNAIERDSYRGKYSVGEDVIKRQWSSYEQLGKPLQEEIRKYNIEIEDIEN